MSDDEKKSGKQSDNDLDDVQQIMKDNDIPTFYSTEDDESKDSEKD